MNFISKEGVYYSDNNIWLRMIDDNVCMAGLTEFLVSTSDDIACVEFISNIVNMKVFKDETIAIVEFLRNSTAIVTPVNGEVIEINDEVIDDPDLILEDPMGKGWLFKIELSDTFELYDLMDRDDYLDFVKE